MQRFDLQIIEQLKKRGYQKLRPDNQNVYGRIVEDAIYVVVLGGTEHLTARALRTYNEIVVRQCSAQSEKKVRLLNILFTEDALFRDEIKRIVAEVEQVWLFTEDYGKLYVFENQPEDFDCLREMLEKDITAEVKTPIDKSRELLGTITPILILLNVLVYIASLMTVDKTGESALMYILTDNLQDVVVRKQYYRVVTSMFYHFSLLHLFSNMVVLIALGASVERRIGKFGFAASYLFCGVAASVCSLVNCYFGNQYVYSGGASGAICGLMGMLIIFSIFQKDDKNNISLRDLLILAALTILNGFVSGVDEMSMESIDNAAHIGGLIAGLLVGTLILLAQTVVKRRQV